MNFDEMKRFGMIGLGMLMVLPRLVAQEGGEAAKASGVIQRLDTVEIRVFREEELTTVGQLSEGGTITMPLIGKVSLQGLTTEQAAARIEAALKDGYLVRPEVRVSIAGRVRKSVTVLGQVQDRGVVPIPAQRPLMLSEAIGMAGGTTRIANLKKVSLKRVGEAPRVVNLQEIIRGRGADIPLKDGDIIEVPESWF